MRIQYITLCHQGGKWPITNRVWDCIEYGEGKVLFFIPWTKVACFLPGGKAGVLISDYVINKNSIHTTEVKEKCLTPHVWRRHLRPGQQYPCNLRHSPHFLPRCVMEYSSRTCKKAKKNVAFPSACKKISNLKKKRFFLFLSKLSSTFINIFQVFFNIFSNVFFNFSQFFFKILQNFFWKCSKHLLKVFFVRRLDKCCFVPDLQTREYVKIVHVWHNIQKITCGFEYVKIHVFAW